MQFQGDVNTDIVTAKKIDHYVHQSQIHTPKRRCHCGKRQLIFQTRELSPSHIVSSAAPQRRDVPPAHPPGPAGETPGAPADAVGAVPEAAPRLRQVQRELRRHGPHTAGGEDTRGRSGIDARMSVFSFLLKADCQTFTVL